MPSIPVCTDLRLGPKTLDIGILVGIGKVQGQSKCMFSANTGNELRVQTLVVDLCVRCEANILETVLLNDIPVICDIIFISM